LTQEDFPRTKMLNLRIEALPSSVYKTRTAGKLNRKLLLSLVVLLSALLVSNSARSFASGLAGSLALTATCVKATACICCFVKSFYVFHFNPPYIFHIMQILKAYFEFLLDLRREPIFCALAFSNSILRLFSGEACFGRPRIPPTAEKAITKSIIPSTQSAPQPPSLGMKIETRTSSTA